MKKMTFILQSKGGVGKSAFAYLLANKNKERKDLKIVDMDNETNTASDQIKFLKPAKHNLINAGTKNIDRSAFDNFFEDFIYSEKYSSALCDLGATTSEQFLVFLKEDGDEIIKALIKMDCEIQVCCVVAGSNAFPASAEYCRELFKILPQDDKISKFIVKNNYFEFTEEQVAALENVAQKTNSKIQDFNIVSGNVPGVVKEIHGLMEAGKSFDDAKTFTKIRLKEALNNVSIQI